VIAHNFEILEVSVVVAIDPTATFVNSRAALNTEARKFSRARGVATVGDNIL
jgi:hypothetical protein